MPIISNSTLESGMVSLVEFATVRTVRGPAIRDRWNLFKRDTIDKKLWSFVQRFYVDYIFDHFGSFSCWKRSQLGPSNDFKYRDTRNIDQAYSSIFEMNKKLLLKQRLIWPKMNAFILFHTFQLPMVQLGWSPSIYIKTRARVSLSSRLLKWQSEKKFLKIMFCFILRSLVFCCTSYLIVIQKYES